MMNKYLTKIATKHELEEGVIWDDQTHTLKPGRQYMADAMNKADRRSRLATAGLLGGVYGTVSGGWLGYAYAGKRIEQEKPKLMIKDWHRALWDHRSKGGPTPVLGDFIVPPHKKPVLTKITQKLKVSPGKFGAVVGAGLGIGALGSLGYSVGGLQPRDKPMIRDRILSDLETKHDDFINHIEGWEKMAKEYYQETRVEDDRLSSKVGAAVMGAVTTGIVQGKIGNHLQLAINKKLLESKPRLSNELLEKLKTSVLPATNTTINLAEAGGSKAFHDALMKGSEARPFYAPKEALEASQNRMHKGMHLWDKVKTMFGGKSDFDSIGDPIPFKKNYFNVGKIRNTDALAHELGHALDLNKGWVKGKMAADGFSRRILGVPSALIGGAMLTNEKTRDYAWTAPLVSALPTLRSEAMANVNAAKIVAQHGGDAKALRGLFAKNTASYALSPILAAATLAGINHLRRKGEEINVEEYIRDE